MSVTLSGLIREGCRLLTDAGVLQILAHNAVHGAFAGFTGITSGLVNTHYVYLPIPVVISSPRRVGPQQRAVPSSSSCIMSCSPLGLVQGQSSNHMCICGGIGAGADPLRRNLHTAHTFRQVMWRHNSSSEARMLYCRGWPCVACSLLQRPTAM